MDIKQKLFSNLGWKIGAIFLALALWFHVSTEKTYERILPAKIETIGLAKDLEVAGIEPNVTRISVIGTGKQLLQLMLSGGVTAYLDLSLISRPGEYEQDINISNLYKIEPSSFHSVNIIGGDHFKITIKSRT